MHMECKTKGLIACPVDNALSELFAVQLLADAKATVLVISYNRAIKYFVVNETMWTNTVTLTLEI